jgi:hypothetical protein
VNSSGRKSNNWWTCYDRYLTSRQLLFESWSFIKPYLDRAERKLQKRYSSVFEELNREEKRCARYRLNCSEPSPANV